MPQRNSNKKERTPAIPLRRSPRFLQIVMADPEDPRTPNLEQPPRRRNLRSNSNKSLQTLDESCNATKRSDNLKSRSRKCTRLTPCAEDCNVEKISRSSKGRNREPERKVTLRYCSRDVDTNAKKAGNTGDDCSLTEEVGVNIISKQSKDKLPKNKVQNSKSNLTFDDNTNTNKGVLSKITENPPFTTNPSIVHDEPTNKKDINNNKNIGEKRKRNQLQEVTHGWSKDQESALERAYLEAKPTPHFWKKVSKLVPGKSAQECFDKVHGSHLTPPPPRLRSRARIIPNSKDPNLSASKFLNSSSPTTKRPKSRKQKSHVIQRTVRHMLQNQYNNNTKGEQQDSESADLFSVLEPTFTQSSNPHLMITTPVRNLDMDGVFNRSSTTVHKKKSLSRFSSGSIVSPPVLKQVKNKALHEKYIDQLHCREAGRSKKCNNGRSEGVKGESSVKRKDALKAAKNALVFGARDAIGEFECKQGMALFDVFEDEFVVSDDDDEDEDGGQVLF